MKLRKINAGVSLITTILLLIHALSLAAWMLSRGSIPRIGSPVAWALAGAVVLHAILSIAIMISSHKGNKKSKVKAYPKMNVPTIVQRLSGILMLIGTGLHIADATGRLQPPNVIVAGATGVAQQPPQSSLGHAILPPLFFILVMAHIAVSTSKAFITLGIGNAKFVKRMDIAVKLLCAVTLIADIVGFYLYMY